MKTTHDKPYFIYDGLKRLREGAADMEAAEARSLKERLALNASDPRAAAEFANLSGDDWQNFYPRKQEATPDTVSAIDTFLATYGSGDSNETALLERLIFNPTPDYATVLATSGDAPAPAATAQDAAIDAFLANHTPQPSRAAGTPAAPPQPAPAAPAPLPKPAALANPVPSSAPKPAAHNAAHIAQHSVQHAAQHAAPTTVPADSTLQESLAKIYIRQGRYGKAYDIISELNLKYPQKSVYFADQLRFLQKLMRLQQSRRQPPQ